MTPRTDSTRHAPSTPAPGSLAPEPQKAAPRWSLRDTLTLRGRLIVLVCFAAVPALFFSFAAAVRERESALDRIERDARHLANLASREHAQQLNGAKALLDRLSDDLACGAAADAPATCPEHLPALLSGLPQLANIGMTDASGLIVCSAAPLAQPASLRSSMAFERAFTSGGIEVGRYVVGFVGRPVLHLARAIGVPGQPPCGVAFVAVELGWLDQLAGQSDLPEDYSLLITDRTGHLLAHSGAAVRGLVGESGRAAADLSSALEAPHGAVVAIGEPPTARYFVATQMAGVPGVYVVASLPFDRVQATANGVFSRTLIGLVLVTTFAIVAAILAAEFSILRVLRSLTRAVRRFGAGDLSARPPLPRSRGELRELARAFGSMADSLAARQREAGEAQDRLRALSHHLQTARDEEAGRIARELHDELGQILTALKMELSQARRRGPDGGRAPEGDAVMGRMQAQIDYAIESVRRISSELRPPVLDRLGLAAAIDWLVRDWETSSGLPVDLTIEGLGDEVDERVSIAVFRVVQEALTNVVRHARATEVHVDLTGAERSLLLTVRDNGRGFEPASVAGPHAVGIIGMRERVHVLGGTLRLEGGIDRGTTVVAEVPRRPAPADALLGSGRLAT
jgi:signal transduction histidine kinase